MGSDHNGIQRAIVFVHAVMLALLNRTFDTFIGFTIHVNTSLLVQAYCVHKAKKYTRFVTNLFQIRKTIEESFIL